MKKREPNSIDFWRGVALISIFINHIPGIWYERFTHRNFGFSDSAELFVLLAGWSLRLTVGMDGPREGTLPLAVRLGGRAVTLYAAQIVITMIAIALIAATAIWLDNPLILDWHNAGPLFREETTTRTHVGLVLLTHQLGYFDILPLYVVLIALAPVIAIIDRYAPRVLLPLSFAIYAAAILFQINAPTWPIPGEWFFNPFAWQFIYVLGFTLARETREGYPLARALPWLRWPAIAIVLAAFWVARTEAWPDPHLILGTPYLTIVEKSYLTPLRLIHVLALCTAFVAVYSGILRYCRPLARFGSQLGRNSLHVFCVGSVLSLVGQLVRVAFPASLALDTVVIMSGVGGLWVTAWLSEARARLRQ